MTRIFLTGANGQVGTTIQEVFSSYDVIATDCTHANTHLDHLCNITEFEELKGLCQDVKPNVIINAAAYTAVDKAESDSETATLVNVTGTKNLGMIGKELNIPVIHFSTDYVFNGAGSQPFRETDQTGPLGVYGKTKLAGELALADSGASFIILRTSWVFSAHGNNFAKTMLRLGSERHELKVVADQIGAPTSADFLARMALLICGESPLERISANCGIYHLCCQGETSWHGFAEEIFRQWRTLGKTLAIEYTQPIPTSEYPTPALRPLNSRLDCSKFEATFQVQRPTWQDELGDVLAQLVAQEST